MAGQNKDDKNGRTSPGSFCIFIKDSDTHEVLWARPFTRMSAVIAAISTLVIICSLAFCIVAFTPLRTFVPGYPDSNSKREALRNAIKIDSLENVIYRWELYTENFRRVIQGAAPVPIDSIAKRSFLNVDTVSVSSVNGQADSLLRKMVSEEEQFSLGTQAPRDLPVEGRHFFTPVKGVVSVGFDLTSHPCLEISAPANSVVMAALDGTVIYSGWSDNESYTVAIQHGSDLVTIYKHNQKILKKTGDKVTAGTPVALVAGNPARDGNDITGGTLWLELWHKGEALDASKYINF